MANSGQKQSQSKRKSKDDTFCLEKLTSSIADGFLMFQQMMLQQYPMPPHYTSAGWQLISVAFVIYFFWLFFRLFGFSI